jgi:hypothetical protein
MSLQRIMLIIAFLFIQSIRLWALKGRWKLPMSWGKDWFFNFKVAGDFYEGNGRDIFQRYRRQTVVPYIVDFIIAAPVFLLGNSMYILPWIVASTAMLLFWHKRIIKMAIKAAKPFAIEQPGDSSVPIALSLTRRRVADYTNLVIETAVAVFTIIGLGIFVRYYWFFNWDGNHTLSALIPVILYFYLQAGGLLLKHGLVRWRLALPGEQTDHYFKLFEDRRQLLIKMYDYYRVICAIGFPVYLFRQIAEYLLHWRNQQWFNFGFGVAVLAVTLLTLRWYVQHMRAIIRRIEPSELMRMQKRIADKPVLFGGLAYFDADNLGVLVRTANGLVLNFANKRMYVYGFYLIGLVTLITMSYIY